MPYETQTDPSLPVHRPLDPAIAGCYEMPSPGGPRRFMGSSGGVRKWFYECRRCGGLIEGHPVESRVDNLAPLSGRRGTEYHCRRCGDEIGFLGLVS